MTKKIKPFTSKIKSLSANQTVTERDAFPVANNKSMAKRVSRKVKDTKKNKELKDD